jgi:uncharacterized protein YqeY
MLRDDINNTLKDAMKAQDQRRVSTLRMVNAAFKNADIDARGTGKGPLSDDELRAQLQKLIKQRQESADLYEKGGRPELATQEREEVAIISSFLPKQMSEDEIKAAVAAVVTETGAASMKDMGRVMAALRERYAGRMDLAKAGGLVRGQLGS